jgi:hypothetical protein
VLFLHEAISLLDEDKAARAEVLFDALGELVGKTLESPTARSIGKLFQKHLTGRPVWIDGEKGVAILRKVPHGTNKDGNQYEIVAQDFESRPGD